MGCHRLLPAGRSGVARGLRKEGGAALLTNPSSIGEKKGEREIGVEVGGGMLAVGMCRVVALRVKARARRWMKREQRRQMVITVSSSVFGGGGGPCIRARRAASSVALCVVSLYNSHGQPLIGEVGRFVEEYPHDRCWRPHSWCSAGQRILQRR